MSEAPEVFVLNVDGTKNFVSAINETTNEIKQGSLLEAKTWKYLWMPSALTHEIRWAEHGLQCTPMSWKDAQALVAEA